MRAMAASVAMTARFPVFRFISSLRKPVPLIFAVTLGVGIKYQILAGKLHTSSHLVARGARRLRRLCSVGEAWLGRRPDTAKVAGSNPAEPTTNKSATIAAHLLDLQKNGYRPSTISSHSSILRHLAKHVDIDQPEEVKLFISRTDVTSSRKNRVVHAYAAYAKSRSLSFSKPFYRVDET